VEPDIEGLGLLSLKRVDEGDFSRYGQLSRFPPFVGFQVGSGELMVDQGRISTIRRNHVIQRKFVARTTNYPFQATERQYALGWIPNIKVKYYVRGSIVPLAARFPTAQFGYLYPLSQARFLQLGATLHGLGSSSRFFSLNPYQQSSYASYGYEKPIGPFNGCIPFWCFCLMTLCYGSGALIAIHGHGHLRFSRTIGFVLALSVVPIWFLGRVLCEREHDEDDTGRYFHGDKLYHKNYLTTFRYCNTFSLMANVLSAEKQTAIIAALAEGSSIRSIERITGVHRDTIMRLGVKVGQGCTKLMDSKMQDLDCNYLQFDELWGFIGKKERHCSVDDNPTLGDVWTFCAIDSETKLVPSFKVGKRTHATTTEFVQDVASRMRHRVQVSSDAMHLYVEAMELAFGADVDYGQCVKVYAHDAAQHPERKYSAPHFASAYRRPITGNPEMELVSTSHVERLNATTRLHMRRLTRLTLAFSKKLENFEAAVGLHFAYYNFVKRHNTLRCTPAMAAGVERDFWTVGQLVEATA
jgi:IS1 family transposase